MLRLALNSWSVRDATDLDPVVKLMLEALSAELYNLSNDLKDTEVRLLEKIAKLLAPDFLTSPNAAHSILHAQPLEPAEVLTEKVHFVTQKKISSKQDETPDKNIDVYFTPVDSVRIFKASVACTVNGGNLTKYQGPFDKQIIATAGGNRSAGANTLWLGLAVDGELDNINDLFFYFDWKNSEYGRADFNYQLLPFSQWYIHDKAVKITEGLSYADDGTAKKKQLQLAAEYDLLTLFENDIKEFYHHKYVTLKEVPVPDIHAAKEVLPDTLLQLFGDAAAAKINERLLWIKIIFPAALHPRALDELNIHTNSFPVMNRQINDLTFRLRNGSNIIPLKVEGIDQFLAIRSLSDETHRFRPTPFRKMEEEEAGTYTLRKGGVERFDNRNAKEFISYLLELLRSESAAFSAFGNDFFASTLGEMNQRIALMEQKMKSLANSLGEIPHYIIARPYEGNETVYAEYWTTLAELANGIRSGTSLQEYNAITVIPESLMLLASTAGGKNRLKPEERVNAFKYGLMTRNRIVTKEDIRNLCYHELGSRIESVSVERGIEMSAHPQHGYVRTIDIFLTAREAEKTNEPEWDILLEQLKVKLQSRSGMSNRYRLMIQK